MQNIDLGAIATLNAQLAGLLAALAFAALLPYLTRSLPGRKHIHIGVTCSVVSAFVLLLIISINYSTVAGIPNAEQMHGLMALHTPSFAIAILLLLLAVAIATQLNPQLKMVKRQLRLMIVLLGPPMAQGEMIMGYLAHFQNKCATCSFFDQPYWYVSPVMWGIVLMVLMTGVSICLMRLKARRAFDIAAYTWPGFFGLVVVVLDFIGHMAISMTPLSAEPTATGMILGELLGALVLMGFTYLAANVLRTVPTTRR